MDCLKRCSFLALLFAASEHGVMQKTLMEEFKKLSKIMKIDEKHILLSKVTGGLLDIELLHRALSEIELNDNVPEEVKGQFNVARNMALYTYYFYALAPEVQHKTYTVIEYALKIKANTDKKLMLNKLLTKAVEEKWIIDSGFRHINNPDKENSYCRSLIDTLPKLRNAAAHGESLLLPDCVGHIEKCADFVNQLFSGNSSHNKESQPTPKSGVAEL